MRFFYRSWSFYKTIIDCDDTYCFVGTIFVNMKNIERNSLELILTIVVLVLLVLFAIKGSGRLSADEYFRRGAAIDKST